MSHSPQKLFQATMQGLSDGLHVRHIATFDLITCDPEDDAFSVLRGYPDFDQIPVRQDGRIVGVLERAGKTGVTGPVKGWMRRLDDALLVSAESPLSSCLQPLAAPPHYRLVVSGLQVDGLVTRSDLLKLPVRVLAFAWVTHLEILMTRIIRGHTDSDEVWMAVLSEGRRTGIQREHDKLSDIRNEPPMLELTNFSDKCRIMDKLLQPGDDFAQQLNEVRTLRNKVAHAGNYAPDLETLEVFLERLKYAEYWIAELSQRYLPQ